MTLHNTDGSGLRSEFEDLELQEDMYINIARCRLTSIPYVCCPGFMNMLNELGKSWKKFHYLLGYIEIRLPYRRPSHPDFMGLFVQGFVIPALNSCFGIYQFLFLLCGETIG